MKSHLRAALAASAAAVFAWALPAFAEEPISYTDTITLDTGTTSMGKVLVTPTAPLPVTIIGGSLITNYALETGGNLASINTHLANLDAASGNPAGLVGTNGTTISSPSNPVDTVARATASGGATPYGLQTTASTNSTNVKNAAGTLYGLHFSNTNTTTYYLRMYDSAAAPTCSSSTNFSRSWAIPAAAAAGQVGGWDVNIPPMGVAFTNGISFCVTGGASSTDNTNAATGILINAEYK